MERVKKIVDQLCTKLKVKDGTDGGGREPPKAPEPDSSKFVTPPKQCTH
jgi:hypothetical protein